MCTIDNLLIIEINNENIDTEYEKILKEIKDSTFISLDIEMSGLGNRKKLNSQLKLLTMTLLQIFHNNF
jgi:hypothetical protein